MYVNMTEPCMQGGLGSQVRVWDWVWDWDNWEVVATTKPMGLLSEDVQYAPWQRKCGCTCTPWTRAMQGSCVGSTGLYTQHTSECRAQVRTVGCGSRAEWEATGGVNVCAHHRPMHAGVLGTCLCLGNDG